MVSKLRLSLYILLVIAFGCKTPTILISEKTNAETAEKSGNFGEAADAWQRFFDQQNTAKIEIAPADFASAAKAAFKAERHSVAVAWFDQARYGNYADPEMYQLLATIFKQQDNLSKELGALEFYSANFTNTLQQPLINNRLFSIYTEIDPDKALGMWQNLDSSTQNNERFLTDYFTLNRKKENNAVCDSLANRLLKINPGHIAALEWNADKYYWQAENRYQREMEKYNNNKTNKHYAVLLKELDMVTAGFKKALTFLDVLWKAEPGKKYAS